MNAIGVIGLFIYEIATGRFEKISEFGHSPKWLNDNRRLISIL
jgi:hypothetical protein